MGKLTIRKQRCKGCLLCASVCPKKVLEQSTDQLNQKGYFPIRAARPDDCIACGLCALICPDCVITVEKEDPKQAKHDSKQ